MELIKLFEVQRKLDAEIEKKHPVQPDEDRLAKRILALQVELGECANEWRGFKFWSTDQQPRTETRESIVGTDETGSPYDSYEIKNPLLEEFVDCLHFILSIGLSTGYEVIDFEKERNENFSVGVTHKAKNITQQFLNTLYHICSFEDENNDEDYIDLFLTFISLGEILGFTWDQVTDAYMSKNQINHERQRDGY